nr:hypothetical protein CFP56_07726 [Quercus suber]
MVAQRMGGLGRNDITIGTNEQKAISAESCGFTKKDIQYIDLCDDSDDSDDEDLIVIQSRIRTPLPNVLCDDLSNRSSNLNMGRLQGEKRPCNAMSLSGPHPRQKKPRLSSQDHGALANNFRSLSPPHSPPPTKDYLITIPTPASTPKTPKSVPSSSTRPGIRVGPFIIDSDSDTDKDDIPQRPVPKLATPRPQSHVLSSTKPLADMAQHETQKWWHQFHALAKTKPELARRLIMQRKAKLLSSVQPADLSSVKNSGNDGMNGMLPADQKNGNGEETLVPLNNSRCLEDRSLDLRKDCQTWVARGDRQIDEKPVVDAQARTTGQLASGVSSSREHEAMTVTSSVSATESHQVDLKAQQTGTIMSTWLDEWAVSQPSASQNSLDAAYSQFKAVQQAPEHFQMHENVNVLTDVKQKAKPHILNPNDRVAFEAAAMSKQANCDEAIQGMQRPIRDSIEAQDRRREVERVERKRRWDEEQEKRRSAYARYLKQTAAKESAIEQQAIIVRAAAEKEAKEDGVLSSKEKTKRAADIEPSRCPSKSQSLWQQAIIDEISTRENRKSPGKQMLPATSCNERPREQRHLEGEVLRDEKQIGPAVPHSTASLLNPEITKPIPTPVLAPRDPREHHPRDVNSPKVRKADQNSGNQLDISSSLTTPRLPHSETARSATVSGFSTNSINGQVKSGQSLVPTKPNPFEPQSSASRKSRIKASGAARTQSRSTARNFGELTLGDVKLYKRKQGQMQWKDLIAFYAQDTGANRSEKHLRKRWRDMCSVIDDRRLGQDTISRAALGDSDALSDLNRTIHCHERAPNKTTELFDQIIATPLIQVVEQHEGKEEEEDQKPKVHHVTNASLTIDGTHQPHVRTVYGGKAINLDSQIAYLQSLQERPALDNDAVKTEKIDHDEDNHDLTEEDYQQFVFSTLRREWDTRDPEDDYESIDDKPWLEYGKPYSRLRDANKAVACDAFKARPGEAAVADPDLEFTMQHRKDATDGTLHITVSSAAGITETRVARRLRDPAIRTLPHSSDDLTSRRTYLVLQREVTHEATDDNLLDAPRRVEKTSLLDMTTHTTLRGANKHAIDHWLQTTFKPTSRNLNMREVETEAQRDLLCIEFDVDGHALPFRKSVTGADGDPDAEYEVWVAEGILAGPRNL